MKIQPVKGTRDFYPPLMAKRNWIIDGWKVVSRRNGFEEYDGPIFEYLKMFQIKSGDEIAEQLFSMTDRGGRELAIRPEITPTLARMVNQQINSLSRPIKWFSVPRLCRAERPQKGRLREFFQWNIDIIGVDDVLADAEVIFTTVDYLRSVGLTEKDVVVKISSRKMLAALLESIGIEESKFAALYAILDKRAKVPDDVFGKMLAEQVPDKSQIEQIEKFMGLNVVNKIISITKSTPELDAAIKELEDLLELLKLMGVVDFCEFDPGIVRGLAYYTGVVFEVYDRGSELRAICGGGRYDNLLRDFGGPAISATGCGMGDCVLGILLEEKGLLTDSVPIRQIDYYVVYADKELQAEAIKLTARLRRDGFGAEFSYKGGNFSKQMKQASAAGAGKCVIIGEEFIKKGQLLVKDMGTGEQVSLRADELV